jgi:replication-associated recombination protein RarA
MLEAGEDALYVARRMVRFATEDVGNADPFALRMALGAMEAFRFLGHPEGDLALAQAAVYLATAPKSNSVYTAWKTVTADRQGKRCAAGSPAYPQRAHGFDEGSGLRQGLPLCPRF